MRRRLRRAGVACNDHVFGIRHSGGMDEAALLQALDHLPPGVTEIYGHPATADGWSASMPHYRHRAELDALCSPRVRATLDALELRRGGFAAILDAP